MPSLFLTRQAVAWICAALLAGCAASEQPRDATAAAKADVSAVAQADPGSRLGADWQHGPFMEIYVRGYQDSDGDGIGDLRGLIQRLDDLRDLGITGLWLMPVTASQDHDHGYAVQDYRAIEPGYGALADFDELLAQAHARGIGVIIDYVIDHSAAQNPLFLQSKSARDNPQRDWYVWANGAPSGWTIYGKDPWYTTNNGAYFAGFWNQMPDFNLRNPAVIRYHQDNLRFWLNRGVDGFRFDAAGNLVENGPAAWENQPENHTVMAAMRKVVMGYANRYMVCEAPSAPQAYAMETSCGGSFAFGHNADIVGAAVGDEASIEDVTRYWDSAPPGMATMISNHDAFAGDRLWDQVEGDAAKYRLAAATYLLQPGTPFIYYGEEIGMAGAGSLSGDWKLRTPMSWTGDEVRAGFTTGTPFRALSANVGTNNVAAQINDPGSLRSFYKTLIALRKSRPSLLRGSHEFHVATSRVLSFQRAITETGASERTLVVFNYGRIPADAALGSLPPLAVLKRLWPAGAADLRADAQGQAVVPMPIQSFTVFAVDTAGASVQ